MAADRDGAASQPSARRPRTAPSPGREPKPVAQSNRVQSDIYNVAVETGALAGDGNSSGAARSSKRGSDATTSGSAAPAKKGPSRRCSGSSAEIRAAVQDTENQEDLPAMFQLNERKQRLLQQHQYEVLWKRAQQKLTTQLYARYPTLVAMFRAFDEDKDGMCR